MCNGEGVHLDRTFRVYVNAEKSQAKSISAGLPQGSILSPQLHICLRPKILQTYRVCRAIYADDTAIYVSANRTATICKNLQKYLAKTEFFSTSGR